MLELHLKLILLLHSRGLEELRRQGVTSAHSKRSARSWGARSEAWRSTTCSGTESVTRSRRCTKRVPLIMSAVHILLLQMACVLVVDDAGVVLFLLLLLLVLQLLLLVLVVIVMMLLMLMLTRIP
jgi:hypothetical protein